MTAKPIPAPNTQDAYGANGFLTSPMQIAIVNACNRIIKVQFSISADAPTADVTDNDITITLPGIVVQACVQSGGGYSTTNIMVCGVQQ